VREAELKDITLAIGGMSCEHCVKRVRKSLDGLAGISRADVTVGKAVIAFDESQLSDDEIEKAIENAGYKILK
jgi:copper ion binding protein